LGLLQIPAIEGVREPRLEARNMMIGQCYGLNPDTLVPLSKRNQFIPLLLDLDFAVRGKECRKDTPTSQVIDYFAANFASKA
jgi:hypothetical protein